MMEMNTNMVLKVQEIPVAVATDKTGISSLQTPYKLTASPADHHQSQGMSLPITTKALSPQKYREQIIYSCAPGLCDGEIIPQCLLNIFPFVDENHGC